jgi:hypothetical protein
MLLKASLWWRHGFPSGPPSAAGLPWTSLAGAGRENESLLVSRRELSRATHALKKLSGEYRHTLPKLAADPDAFIASTQALLDAIKPAVHRMQPPVTNALVQRLSPRLKRRAEWLSRERPQLASLLDAVIWVCATAPERLGKMLSALEQHADELASNAQAEAEQSPLTALNLVDLMADLGAEPVVPLLRVLADPRVYARPLRADDYPEKLRRVALSRYDEKIPRPPTPLRPTPSLGPRLHAWAQWTAAQNRTARRRALECFSLLGVQTHLGDWADWWHELEKPERRLNADVSPRAMRADLLDKLQRRVHQLAETKPAPVSAGGVTELLRWYAAVASPEFTAAVCAALRALDDERLALPFLQHWQGLYLTCGDKLARRGADGVRAYLARTAPCADARLLPWENVWKQWRTGKRLPRYGFEEELLSQRPGKGRVDALYAALALACEGGAANEKVADALAELAGCDLDPSTAVEVAVGLAHPKLYTQYIAFETLRRTLRLVSGEPTAALELLSALASLENNGDQRHGLRVLEDLQKTGMLGVGLALVADGQMRRLAECGNAAEYLRSPVTLQTIVPGDRQWLARYPEALRAELLELCACDEWAERTANRILKRHFPRPEDLAQQIEVLENKIASAALPDQSLKRRLDSLQARLGDPPRVSSQRLHHLASALQRAAREAALRRLEDQSRHAVIAMFERLLGVSPLPDWATDPTNLRVILPILQLPDASKRLAQKLLRVRAGPPPWDLRDAPENAAFLQQLRSRGVATDAWVDGELSIRAEHGGETLTLALESDPLRIFEMGAHFNTCLSPGSFNFFSVFANAADINKRVLYARSEDGRVVGRCLLALTEAGGLLTFHPYAHSNGSGFDELVARFVRELAEQMGVVPVARGQVPLLVAPDWYDDGPRDLCRRFAFLEPGSAFRKALAKQIAETFVELLRKQFSPLELNELTLPLVLELPELADNPPLIRPLLPLVAKLDALPGTSALAAARLTLALGEVELAKRMFAKRIERYVVWYFRRHHHFESNAAGLLVDLEPRLTLRLLRMTRPRGVRSWKDEFEFHRFELAARAYEALHRSNKAIEMYRLAEGTDQPAAIRQLCRERVREIEGAR